MLTSSQIPELGSTIDARYFVCSPADVELIHIGSTHPARNWTRYGTNASFFNGTTKVMTAFHIWNGSSIRAGGDTNCADQGDSTTRMDCEYCLYLPSTGSYSMNSTQRTNTMPSSTGNVTRWAIGGFDLMVSGSYSSESLLKTAIDTRFSTGSNPYVAKTGSITGDNWLPGYGTVTGARL